MKNQKKEDISRKEALKKIGNYGKYAALTAVGTYMFLNPKNSKGFLLELNRLFLCTRKKIISGFSAYKTTRR